MHIENNVTLCLSFMFNDFLFKKRYHHKPKIQGNSKNTIVYQQFKSVKILKKLHQI